MRVTNEPNMITIPLDEYEQLKKDQEFLQQLEAAGVDNWEGYSEAFRKHEDNKADW